ncbi:MAG: ParM/StbA family protein [Chloroflexi bacterium]|nr:ParM/StbA family protein [Chloroflexota bacterium]
MSITVHGANIGHGFVKYTINENGEEQTTIFPAIVAPAASNAEGSLHDIPTVEVHGTLWWTGEHALLAPSPLSLRSQQRLYDRHIIPALVKGALQRLGQPTGGACVTGLPAAWIGERDLAVALAGRLRDAVPSGFFHGATLKTGIRVISEPLGALYGVLLDETGRILNLGYETGRIGVIDLGHNTVDACIVQALNVIPDSAISFELGSANPLQQLQTRISGRYNIDLTLHDVDQAVRKGYVRVAGEELDLPTGWERPWEANGQQVADAMVRAWGSGGKLDAIIIAGGGAELPILVRALQQRFRQAIVAPNPQTAIARGYARRARRYEELGQ